MMISPRTGTTVLNNTYTVPGGAGFHVTMQRNGSLLIQDQGGRVTLRVARFGEAFEFDAVDAATKQRVVYREVLGAVTGTVDGVAVVGWGGVDAYFGTSIYMRMRRWMPAYRCVALMCAQAQHRLEKALCSTAWSVSGFCLHSWRAQPRAACPATALC